LLITLGTRAWAQHAANAVPADQALVRLMQGNARYARNEEQHPDETLARRRELQARAALDRLLKKAPSDSGKSAN
jgi:hypothetical protein